MLTVIFYTKREKWQGESDPSLNRFFIPELLHDHRMGDAVTIIGSLACVVGEVDR